MAKEGSAGPLTRTVTTNGIRMRITEQGPDSGPTDSGPAGSGPTDSGPAVVLCHGFPGLGYSWRHQLGALAAAGWRAIAPDMRGYGGTDAPTDASRYDRATTVADLVGLLDALEIDRAVFVGHDFGAALTWDMPNWAPDRVRALIQLSVPRAQRSPVLPSTAFAHIGARHFLHLHYFQERGVAERELDPRPEEFLHRLFWALSGGGDYFSCWREPEPGQTLGYLDVLPPAPPLPWPWLTRDEFDRYVAEFRRTGFGGGLNWYRADDAVWRQNAPYDGSLIEVPTLFIAGTNDPAMTIIGEQARAAMAASVPGLFAEYLIDGAGHFVQMEAAEQVNALMLDFLARL